MRRIFHLLPAGAWNPEEPLYRASSLAVEGFAHCANAEQVEPVANLFFPASTDLVALEIDAERLSSPLRDEDSGTGELFPHVYGPIERDAVAAVRPLARGTDGLWHFEASSSPSAGRDPG